MTSEAYTKRDPDKTGMISADNEQSSTGKLYIGSNPSTKKQIVSIAKLFISQLIPYSNEQLVIGWVERSCFGNNNRPTCRELFKTA